jgi:hypothetical protein
MKTILVVSLIVFLIVIILFLYCSIVLSGRVDDP